MVACSRLRQRSKSRSLTYSKIQFIFLHSLLFLSCFRFSLHMPRCILNRRFISVCPQPANHSDSFVAQVAVMAECFPRMDIADVNLDEGNVDAHQRGCLAFERIGQRGSHDGIDRFAKKGEGVRANGPRHPGWGGLGRVRPGHRPARAADCRGFSGRREGAPQPVRRVYPSFCRQRTFCAFGRGTNGRFAR